MNLADCMFSGNNEFRKLVRSEVAAALSSALASSGVGSARWYEAMIWSAVLLRSEDLTGAKALICIG